MFDFLSSKDPNRNKHYGRRGADACAAVLATLLLLTLTPVLAQQAVSGAENGGERSRATRHGSPIIPDSNRANAGDAGQRAHTNFRYFAPETASPSEAPPESGLGYETPASLACLYGVVQSIPGCNPNDTTNTPWGGSRTIVIVDAYDDPNAAADLKAFSEQFGLPFSREKFHVVYASGKIPPEDPTGNWEMEESLDIEYAHAMAPHATLYLVEANSNNDSDLYPAVQVASNLVACGRTTACPPGSRGRGEVSISWGEDEYAQETSFDSTFTSPGVVYLAAAGDNAGVIYPCASPNVVCAGGTSTARNEYTGNLIEEIAWSDAGGGVSFYEPIPGYQSGIPAIARQVGVNRGVPDISADANPNTGAWVLDTNAVPGAGWWIVGGTSLAAPTVAGIVNAAGHFAASSTAELTTIYSSQSAGSFNDITYGACGNYSGTFSARGWDLCTGFGSPKNLGGH
jgi:subtilase family serine protease